MDFTKSKLIKLVDTSQLSIISFYKYYLSSKVVDDVLVISFYTNDILTADKFDLKFVHFVNKEHRFITYLVKSKSWGTGYLSHYIDEERERCGFRQGRHLQKVAYTDGVNDAVRDFFGNQYIIDAVTWVEHIEETFRQNANAIKRLRNEELWDAFMDGIEEVPTEFVEWAYKVALKGYCIYDRKTNKATCTSCGNTTITRSVKKLTRNSFTTCPNCNKHLYALPSGRYKISDKLDVGFVQQCNDGIIARIFEVSHYNSSHQSQGDKYFIIEHTRILFTNSGEASFYVFDKYYNGIQTVDRWIPEANQRRYSIWTQPRWNYGCCAVLWKKSCDFVANTKFKYAFNKELFGNENIVEVLRVGGFANYVKAFFDYPALETILKHGNPRLALAIIEGKFKLKRYEKDFYKSFMLPKQLVKERIYPLLTFDADRLNVIQQVYVHYPHKFTEELACVLNLNRITASAAVEIFRHSAVSKILKYLSDNTVPMNDYYDYISALNRANAEINDDSLFPQNFQLAHRRQNEFRRSYNQQKYCEQQAEKYAKLIKSGFLKQYKEYSDDNYIIRLPCDPLEFLNEGTKQHNCVFSYISRVLSGSTVVLLMRKKDTPDTPLCTVEVNNGKIIQVRRKYNQNATKEEFAFVEKYLKEIA